jgi:hypothetical protein
MEPIDTLPRYVQLGTDAPTTDQYNTMTVGHVALAGAGGIVLGMIFAWIYCENRHR